MLAFYLQCNYSAIGFIEIKYEFNGISEIDRQFLHPLTSQIFGHWFKQPSIFLGFPSAERNASGYLSCCGVSIDNYSKNC